MDEVRAVTLGETAGAWWRAAVALAWVAGVALQLQQPVLWSVEAYPLLAAGALAAWLASRRLRGLGWGGLARSTFWLAVAAAGFAVAGWRADTRLADALAPAWEGCDIELVGTVDDLPQLTPDGARFAFAVESARALPMTARELKRVQALDAAAGRPLPSAVVAAESAEPSSTPSQGIDDDDEASPAAAPPGAGAPVVPSRVWLAWSRNQRDDRAVADAPPPLRAGQRWRLPVRLRRPHGTLNPDGFDAELWLFDQGLRATGTVRGNGRLLETAWSPIANARQWVRDRLLLMSARPDTDQATAAGALAALAVGDQAAIWSASIQFWNFQECLFRGETWLCCATCQIKSLDKSFGSAVSDICVLECRRHARPVLLPAVQSSARDGGLTAPVLPCDDGIGAARFRSTFPRRLDESSICSK